MRYRRRRTVFEGVDEQVGVRIDSAVHGICNLALGMKARVRAVVVYKVIRLTPKMYAFVNGCTVTAVQLL
jgi:hypothetical protein